MLAEIVTVYHVYLKEVGHDLDEADKWQGKSFWGPVGVFPHSLLQVHRILTSTVSCAKARCINVVHGEG